MKKIILFSLFLFGIATTVQAQNFSKNALGLRLGDNDGFGAELSYQRGLSAKNRLELDLGFRSRSNNDNDFNAFKLTGVYQWVWKIEGGFNWYAGVGGGVGSYSYKFKNDTKDSGAFVFVAGDLGIEYNFQEAPIQLALDIRPELYFTDGYRDNNFGPDLALSIRYRFN
jgi:hypothetical protein